MWNGTTALRFILIFHSKIQFRFYFCITFRLFFLAIPYSFHDPICKDHHHQHVHLQCCISTKQSLNSKWNDFLIILVEEAINLVVERINRTKNCLSIFTFRVKCIFIYLFSSMHISNLFKKVPNFIYWFILFQGGLLHSLIIYETNFQNACKMKIKYR